MYNEETIAKLRKCVGAWEVTCLVNLLPDFALNGIGDGWVEGEVFNHLTDSVYFTRSTKFDVKYEELFGEGLYLSNELIVNFIHATMLELHENPEYKRSLRYAEILQTLRKNELWVNRKDIIKFYVEVSVRTVSQDLLYDIYEKGFVGYSSMSNEELEDEWCGYTFNNAVEDIEQLEPHVASLKTKLRDLILSEGDGPIIRIRPYDMPEEMELFWIEDL